MNASKAFAATQVLHLLTVDTLEFKAVIKYLETLGYSAAKLQKTSTDNPAEELVGLDECLQCIASVNPNVGKAGSVRKMITDRLADNVNNVNLAYSGLPTED